MEGLVTARLEIAGMRTAVQVAMSERQLQFDADLNKALDSALRPEALEAIIAAEVNKAVTATLQEVVKDYFRWNGAGRAKVVERAHKSLAEILGEDLKGSTT